MFVFAILDQVEQLGSIRDYFPTAEEFAWTDLLQPGEFLARYGLTAERFARAAEGAVIMHPGPINRGVEIEGGLADHPAASLIVRQVEMGVAVRMACLDRLTAGRRG